MLRKEIQTVNNIIFIALLILALSLPTAAHGADKKVLLLPLAVYAERPLDHIRKGASSMLASRLAGGGIAVLGQERIEPYLREGEKKGITSEKRAEELIGKLDADYAIFGSITAVGSTYSLDFSLLKSEKGGSPLTRFSKVVAEDRFIPEFSDVANQLRAAIEGKRIAQREISETPVLPKRSPAKEIFSKLEDDKERLPDREKGMAFKPITESKPLKPTGTIPLDMEVMSFDTGDLDGDGNVELVIVDREKMLVYRREGKSFVLIDTLKASWGEEFFKVSVGDIDSNGKAEIYVVSLYGMRARSSVFVRASELTRLSRMTGHLRVVKDPIEMKTLLLFQGSKVNQFFSGPVCYMNYGEKGKPDKGPELPEMRGAQFYTLMRCDLDEDGNHEWVGLGKPNLNEKSRLHVWGDRGQLLWRGKRELGGTNNAIRAGEAAPEGLPPRIFFNSRLVFADIDGDGSRDVIAIDNIPMIGKLLNFKVYAKSQLIAYRIESTTLLPAWTTGEIDYCVTDMQTEDKSLFLAAHKGKVSNIGKKSGLIMWFE
jgi:hypothetical protein